MTEVAHQSAAAVVGVGRGAHDPVVTERLVAIVDELGLDTIALAFGLVGPAREARSGRWWRRRAARVGVRRSPVTAAREYAAGMRVAEFNHVVAGVAEPPGPDELRALVDTILTGV